MKCGERVERTSVLLAFYARVSHLRCVCVVSFIEFEYSKVVYFDSNTKVGRVDALQNNAIFGRSRAVGRYFISC